MTITQEGYDRLVAEGITRGLPDDVDLDEWRTEDLEQDVMQVRQMIYDNGKRIDPAWPATLARFARVVLGADSDAERAIIKEMMKK